MILETQISYGYKTLIETFCKANNLDINIMDMSAYPYGKIILLYEDNSETAITMSFMSMKHLGFENMLCDYLIKCGTPPSLIPIGKVAVKRDMIKLDKEWEEHRKAIGLR